MGEHHPWLRVGGKVEVIRSVGWSSSKYFGATLIAPSYDSEDKYVVEYESLVREEDGEALQEDVSVGVIRPRPPVDICRFKCDDRVDVLFNGSWWQGVVTKVVHKSSRYMVHFECVDQTYQFKASDLRIHRDWTTHGTWVPPLDQTKQSQAQAGGHEVKQEQVDEFHFEEGIDEIKGGGRRNNLLLFGEGTLVEVRSDEEGLEGAWFAATIVKKVVTRGDGGMSNNKFLVEYVDLRSDLNEEEHLKEEVDVGHLRPYPPSPLIGAAAAADYYYSNHDRVDAWYNDGWWEGKIRRVLGRCMYLVYFDATGDESDFHQSQLRPHHDWIDGNWVTSSSFTIPQHNKSTKQHHHSAT